MTLVELRDRLIEDGIASVRKHETRLPRLRGGVAGFEACRKLLLPVDFESALAERHRTEVRIARAVSADEYWEYRYATVQIEYVYGVMKVAYGFPILSASAILRYNHILTDGASTASVEAHTNGGAARDADV